MDWEIDVAQAGVYEIMPGLNEADKPAIVRSALGEVKMQREVPSKATCVAFNNMQLPSGKGRLECVVEQAGVRDVEIKRVKSSLVAAAGTRREQLNRDHADPSVTSKM